MLKKYSLLACFSTALLLSSCASKIDDLKDEKETSNIAVTETDGIVVGTINASATTDQRMVAAAGSNVADASVTFPPGSLSISTEISLGEATDRSAAILSEVGITGVSQGTTPIYVGPASGTVPNVAGALTIQLPLPLNEAGVSLTDGTSKLILIYTIFNNGWKSGVVPLDSTNLIGAYMKLAMNGLGYFQIMYLNTAAAAKEVSSQVVPKLGTNAKDGITTQPFTCYKESTKICQRYGVDNPGAAAEKIAYCKEDRGTVSASCPEASFMGSCSYADTDLKYYFYPGSTGYSSADCQETQGTYSKTYTDASN